MAKQSASELNEAAQLRRDIDDLQRQARQIPSRWKTDFSDMRATVLQVVGGQALAVIGLDGIKVALTQPASIANYDLATLPTCVDGIGYGTNVITGRLELIANCPPSWHRWDLIAGQVIEALSSIRMLITASSPASYRTVWVPSKLVG